MLIATFFKNALGKQQAAYALLEVLLCRSFFFQEELEPIISQKLDTIHLGITAEKVTFPE